MSKETVDHAYGQVEIHKACKTWADRQKDYKFFTPGLLYWNMMVDRDLIEDFIASEGVPKGQRPKKYVSDIDIFDIDPPTTRIKTPKGEIIFNIAKTIYICPLETWPQLDKFLMGCGFTDARTGIFSQSMKQPDLLIPDFGAIKNGYPSLERISVAAYGLYSNQFCSIWRTYKSDVYIPPKAILADSSEVMIEEYDKFKQEYK